MAAQPATLPRYLSKNTMSTAACRLVFGQRSFSGRSRRATCALAAALSLHAKSAARAARYRAQHPHGATAPPGSGPPGQQEAPLPPPVSSPAIATPPAMSQAPINILEPVDSSAPSPVESRPPSTSSAGASPSAPAPTPSVSAYPELQAPVAPPPSTDSNTGPSTKDSVTLSEEKAKQLLQDEDDRRKQHKVPLKWQPPAPLHIAELIGGAETFPELHRILALYGGSSGDLTAFHACAALSKMASLIKQCACSPHEARQLSVTIPAMAALVQARRQDISPSTIVTALYSLACLEWYEEKLFTDLTQQLELELASLQPQGLANAFWALAKMRHRPPARWVEAFLAALFPKLSFCKPQELSSILWALSKLQYQVTSPQMEQILASITAQLSLYEGHALSNVASALARSPHRPTVAWMDAFYEQVMSQRGSFTPQGISQLMWALAKLSTDASGTAVIAAASAINGASTHTAASLTPLMPPPEPWLTTMLWYFFKDLRGIKGIDLATMLWAYASLEYQPTEPLLLEMLRRAAFEVPRLRAQHLANIVWALARLVGRQPQAGTRATLHGWFLAVLTRSHQDLKSYKPQDISNILWGLATMRFQPPPSWLAAMASAAELHAARFKEQEIANTIWAFARFAWRPPRQLLLEFFDTTDRRLSSFRPVELVSMLWAIAKLQLPPNKQWADEMLKTTFHKMGELTPQGLGLVVWSLAELKLQPTPAWIYHCVNALRKRLPDLGAQDLGQVIMGLRRFNAAQPLQKTEDFLLDALDRLSGLEMQDCSYTAGQLRVFLSMDPAHMAQIFGLGPDGSLAGRAAAGEAKAMLPAAQGAPDNGGIFLLDTSSLEALELGKQRTSRSLSEASNKGSKGRREAQHNGAPSTKVLAKGTAHAGLVLTNGQQNEMRRGGTNGAESGKSQHQRRSGERDGRASQERRSK